MIIQTFITILVIFVAYYKFFGYSCSNERDCPDGLYCFEGTCVECLNTKTCETPHMFCSPTKQCEYHRPCYSTRDCKLKYKAKHGRCFNHSYCVQCVHNKDCKVGDMCLNNICVEKDPPALSVQLNSVNVS